MLIIKLKLKLELEPEPGQSDGQIPWRFKNFLIIFLLLSWGGCENVRCRNFVFREISLEFRETRNQNLGNILAILQKKG